MRIVRIPWTQKTRHACLALAAAGFAVSGAFSFDGSISANSSRVGMLVPTSFSARASSSRVGSNKSTQIALSGSAVNWFASTGAGVHSGPNRRNMVAVVRKSGALGKRHFCL